ncbi:MAG: hypothetical protein RIB59_13795 [Rhodospirillales bacterium]
MKTWRGTIGLPRLFGALAAIALASAGTGYALPPPQDRTMAQENIAAPDDPIAVFDRVLYFSWRGQKTVRRWDDYFHLRNADGSKLRALYEDDLAHMKARLQSLTGTDLDRDLKSFGEWPPGVISAHEVSPREYTGHLHKAFDGHMPPGYVPNKAKQPCGVFENRIRYFIFTSSGRAIAIKKGLPYPVIRMCLMREFVRAGKSEEGNKKTPASSPPS